MSSGAVVLAPQTNTQRTPAPTISTTPAALRNNLNNVPAVPRNNTPTTNNTTQSMSTASPPTTAMFRNSNGTITIGGNNTANPAGGTPSSNPAGPTPSSNPAGGTSIPTGGFTTPGNVVNILATQSNPYQVRVAGNCDCNVCSTPGACNVTEWQYGTQKCCSGFCPPLPQCSQPDPSVCPVFSSGGPQSVQFSAAPTVQCSYSPSQFTNLPDVQKYSSLYGQDTNYNQVIMPAFCSQRTAAGVSRMVDTGPEGTLCKPWAGSNKKMAQTVQATYCQQNPTDPACACYNRSKDPGYQALKQYAPADDRCWYAPCQKPGVFIPVDVSTVNGVDTDTPTCPPNFCAQINQGFINNQQPYVSFADASAATSCNLQKPVDPTAGYNQRFWWTVILFILLLLIIGFLLYYATRSPPIPSGGVPKGQISPPPRNSGVGSIKTPPRLPSTTSSY
jgi:hypothetical protein